MGTHDNYKTRLKNTQIKKAVVKMGRNVNLPFHFKSKILNILTKIDGILPELTHIQTYSCKI